MHVYTSWTSVVRPTEFPFPEIPLTINESTKLGNNTAVLVYNSGEVGLGKDWSYTGLSATPALKKGRPSGARIVPNDDTGIYLQFQFRFELPDWIHDNFKPNLPFRLRLGLYFNRRIFDERERTPLFTVSLGQFASNVVSLPFSYSAISSVGFFQTQLAGLIRSLETPYFEVSLDNFVDRWAPNRAINFDFRITTDWEVVFAGAYDSPPKGEVGYTLLPLPSPGHAPLLS